MSKNKGALIIADVKNLNIGDQVIFQSLRDILLSSGFSHVYKLSNYSKRLPDTTHLKFFNPLAVVTAFRKSRVIYIGGGGIFQDNTGIWNLVYFGFFTWLAVVFRKKIIIKSVGVTPLYSMISERIVSFICKHADEISVRDVDAQKILAKFTDKQVKVEKDLAFSYRFQSNHDVVREKIATLAEERYLIVSLRPLLEKSGATGNKPQGKLDIAHSNHVFLTELSLQLTKICDFYNITPLFLPFYPGQDNPAINHFTSQYFTGKFIHEEFITADEYAVLAKNAQMVICMRLHAAILGDICSAQVFALSYSYKVEHFMNSIGRQRCCIDLADTNQLYNIIEKEYVGSKEYGVHAKK